jgi:hypothetical protein
MPLNAPPLGDAEAGRDLRRSVAQAYPVQTDCHAGWRPDNSPDFRLCCGDETGDGNGNESLGKQEMRKAGKPQVTRIQDGMKRGELCVVVSHSS